MAELHWMSAFDLAGMIRRRELKPSELVAASLSRIEALNPKFNAFCALRAEGAMAEAHALDEKIARREETGILAGLPLGVKDLEGVAGMATTFGSVPFKDNIAKEDSIQVGRLRAAGAIVIGKTNTPEFGFTPFTKNLLLGERAIHGIPSARPAVPRAAVRRRWSRGWYRLRPARTGAARFESRQASPGRSGSSRRKAESRSVRDSG